jgi:hypothetical protein
MRRELLDSTLFRLSISRDVENWKFNIGYWKCACCTEASWESVGECERWMVLYDEGFTMGCKTPLKSLVFIELWGKM